MLELQSKRKIVSHLKKKMTRLTTELYGLFKESHTLEDEIKRKLAAIGYGEGK